MTSDQDNPQTTYLSNSDEPAVGLGRRSVPDDVVRGESVRQAVERPFAVAEPEESIGPDIRHPEGKHGTFDAADVIVLVLCELIAIPLCHAGWHAVVMDHHIGRALVALFVGLPIGIAGASFHWWKNKTPTLRGWILRQAKVWWPAAVAVALIYVAGPEIYRRATVPVAVTGAIGVMPIGTASLEEAVKQATKTIEGERDEAIKNVARTAKERDDAIRQRDAAIAESRRTATTPSNLGRVSWSNLFNGLTQPGQLRQMPGWWIIITASPDNSEAEKELSTLFMLSSNLSKTFGIAGLPDYSRDLDAPKLDGKALRGITVHGRNDAADFIAATLSNCFSVLRTAEIPGGLFDYYRRQSVTVFPEDKFVWLEIGVGSPWKGNCRD